jgi:[lysine-biosynthesis-protein LysW]--L-2-aminoadipate ligase
MTTSPPAITLLASRINNEEKLIMSAIARHGFSYDVTDSRKLFVALHGNALPSVVLNREIGHFRATYAATALEAAGARVLNTAAATATCGDKWLTSVELNRRGLPTPRTSLAMTPAAALPALDEIGYPAVLKPLVGSWGRMVTAVTDRHMAAAVLEHVEALPAPQSHVVYVQELVPKLDRDIRVIVVGGAVVGATYRRGAEWRTNVARGAVSEPCELDDTTTKLAVAAAEAVGADIAGVDLLEDGEGRVFVLEVNHRVEFAGFQKAHEGRVDVADRIVAHVIAKARG